MRNRYTRSNPKTGKLTTGCRDGRDEQVIQALVTAGALVALADGRVQAVERDELLNFIDQQQFVPTISKDQIGEAFDNRVQELQERDSASVIVETFRPLVGLSLASVVVRTATRIAAADRQIHFGEVRALELIRLIMINLPKEQPTEFRS